MGMGHRRSHYWRPPRPCRHWRGLSFLEQLCLSVLAGLLLAVMAITLFHHRFRPVILDMAATRVDNMVSLAISEVVADDIALGHVSYDDLISFERDESGQTVALKSNMGEANLLRVHIMRRLVEELSQLTIEELFIPMGNLTGNMLLSGLGPDIPVRVLSIGSASAGFENQFSSAGINQTRHQIVLKIMVTVDLLLPGGAAQHTVDSRITVAETVLMGQVPENYTYFSQFDNAKEAADHYFLYGNGQ